jgi:hypothetical protein
MCGEDWVTMYISSHVDEAEALADVVAYNHDIGLQQPPVVRAGGVEKLQPVWPPTEVDLEDERLVNVPQERNGVDVLARAEPPTSQGWRVSYWGLMD